MDVLREIDLERKKQIAKGYGVAHDDEHSGGQIITAAANIAFDVRCEIQAFNKETWVDTLAAHVQQKYRGDKKKRLIIATAMLVAEIERLDRLENPS